MLFSHHRDPDQASAATAGMLEAKKCCSKDALYASVEIL